MRIKSERLAWREIDGELVALDLDRSTYFTANDTASALIKCLAEGSRSKAELVQLLLDGFEVDGETARIDVDRFVDFLDAQGLLER